MALARRLALLVRLAPVVALGCSDDQATQVVADNDYASDAGPGTEMTVFKVWWVTTLLPDPVAPGAEGQAQRTVASSDYAYAVLAPGWDPSSGSPPAKFLAAKSLAPLTAARGQTLHVRVSDATFAGDCAAGMPLSQDDADFITQRIFPAEFPSGAYDAATCAVSPAGDADGGLDAGDGGNGDVGDLE